MIEVHDLVVLTAESAVCYDGPAVLEGATGEVLGLRLDGLYVVCWSRGGHSIIERTALESLRRPPKKSYEERRAALVTDAALAVESIDPDELERHAEQLAKKKGARI